MSKYIFSPRKFTYCEGYLGMGTNHLLNSNPTTGLLIFERHLPKSFGIRAQSELPGDVVRTEYDFIPRPWSLLLGKYDLTCRMQSKWLTGTEGST